MNIRDVLESFNVPIAPPNHHHSRAGWQNIDCPFCSADSNRFLLGISETSFGANCYQCGPHKSYETLALVTRSSKGQLFEILQRTNRNQDDKPEQPTGKYTPPPGAGKLLRPHRDYLRSRGLKPKDIERLWQVKGLGVAGIMSWRLLIPVFRNAVPVSFLTRAIGEGRGRYLSANPVQESFPHKETLYGLDFVRHAAVIHEGPVDAWTIGPGAVAVCGLSFTDAQVNLIRKIPVRAVCFDAEPEAQKRAKALCDAVSVFPGETYNIALELGKDANDPAARKEVKQIRRTILKG